MPSHLSDARKVRQSGAPSEERTDRAPSQSPVDSSGESAGGMSSKRDLRFM